MGKGLRRSHTERHARLRLRVGIAMSTISCCNDRTERPHKDEAR